MKNPDRVEDRAYPANLRTQNRQTLRKDQSHDTEERCFVRSQKQPEL